MTTYIALLRGINVIGKNSLPMKGLVAVLEGMGAGNVRTYIQSGNAVFQSASKNAAQLAAQLSARIEKHYGFSPRVLILEPAAIEAAIARNPFPEAETVPTTLHLGILVATPTNLDLKKLDKVRKASERFQLIDHVFYLHTPEGVGHSKLPASAEKVLGVPMTYRNWRTVCKIGAMARELEAAADERLPASR